MNKQEARRLQAKMDKWMTESCPDMVKPETAPAKSKLILLDPSTEAAGLAKLYEKITGKSVSTAEVQAAQREIDAARGRKRSPP